MSRSTSLPFPNLLSIYLWILDGNGPSWAGGVVWDKLLDIVSLFHIYKNMIDNTIRGTLLEELRDKNSLFYVSNMSILQK